MCKLKLPVPPLQPGDEVIFHVKGNEDDFADKRILQYNGQPFLVKGTEISGDTKDEEYYNIAIGDKVFHAISGYNLTPMYSSEQNPTVRRVFVISTFKGGPSPGRTVDEYNKQNAKIASMAHGDEIAVNIRTEDQIISFQVPYNAVTPDGTTKTHATYTWNDKHQAYDGLRSESTQ